MDDVRAERDEAVKQRDEVTQALNEAKRENARLRAIMSVLRAALDQAEREGGIEHG
jgi:hypothetical protein